MPGTRHNKLARRDPTTANSRKNSPSTAPPAAFPRKSSPSTPQNGDFGPFWACRANFFALTPTIRPRRANFFAHRCRSGRCRAKNIAHRTQKHGDVETNNTTAHPQQGTYETGITSAPEKHTKNTQFSPAKAMAVSTRPPHRPAKATMVSNHRATWPTGPGRGARGP